MTASGPVDDHPAGASVASDRVDLPDPSAADVERPGSGESLVTVVVAGVANLLIAAAKAVGAVVSGSAAMLSESAHSVADTVTEVLLFVAVRRGARPPDARHPLGYGRESYLWALLAALATFVAGAVVSVLEGVDKVLHGEEHGDLRISFAVLAIAFVIEGISLLRALKQAREGARRWRTTVRGYLRHTTDTTVKAVTFEDSAALAGLLLAAVGLGLSDATGDPAWDGAASVVIGGILVVVAASLARANASLLVGRAAVPALDRALRAELEGLQGVQDVPLFLTTITGPGRLVVAAKVEFADHFTADDIERVSDEVERRMVARFPGVEHVFLDPTASRRTARASDRPVPSRGQSRPPEGAGAV